MPDQGPPCETQCYVRPSFVLYQGARTPLAVATSLEEEYLVTGKYFRKLHQMDRQDTIPINDTALATKLWETCDAMAAATQ